MRRRRGVIYVALLFPVVLSGAGLAHGQDGDAEEEADEDEPLELPGLGVTAFSITNTTIAQYRFDNFNLNQYDDDFLAFTEKLEVRMLADELEAGLRIDGFVPLLDTTCPAGFEAQCVLEWDLRPERVLLRARQGDFTMVLGDEYVVFGRGLAANFRREDTLGQDTAVRGAQLQYDGGRFAMHLVSGLANPQNLDPVTLAIVNEPRDIVAGASVTARFGEYDDYITGLHAMHYRYEQELATGREVDATVFGWRLELPALFDGRLAFYGEVNGLIRNIDSDLLGADRETGRGIYASLQLSLDRFSLLVEWKDYRNFLVPSSINDGTSRIYHAPPPTDLDTERFRGVHNSRGGSFLLSYAFQPGPWSAAIGGIFYGHEQEDSDIDPWDGILVNHGYLQIQRSNLLLDEERWGWTLDFIGGYRREIYLRDPFPDDDAVNRGDPEWEVIHFIFDGSIARGEHSLELRVEQRFEEHRFGPFTVLDYIRGGASLTYSFGGDLSISPALLWSTEKSNQPTLYPGGEIKWQFRPGSHVRIFGGRTPGGRICSGGICRDVPPFEGALGELVLRI